MYYEHTITDVRGFLRIQGHEAIEDTGGIYTPNHILWLCEQTADANEKSFAAAITAAVTVGKIIAAMEQHYRRGMSSHPESWDPGRSESLLQMDHNEGLHCPLWVRWLYSRSEKNGGHDD